MTKLKNNVLIAEFMDLRNTGMSIYKESDYKYHKSWDWLMPVIIKMADIREDTHYKLYKTIDVAYKEVVEFINQLNK